MSIHGLNIQYFRCHKQLTVKFSPSLTVIVGSNASGKTAIIEALVLLSTGESFRAEHDQDMIAFGQELARVKTKLDGQSDDELEVVLTRGVLQGKAVQKKHYFVNGTPRRKKDFLGHFPTVIFRPEDMRLVEGSPQRRRQFIDAILSVMHRPYAESLTTYENALKRRNKLIEQVQQQEAPRTVLTYWTNLLLKHGTILQELRREFFQSFASTQLPLQLQVEYLPSLVTEERFVTYVDREIAAGHTFIGPHKDDFVIKFIAEENPEWLDVSQFGSRGQQRLAVLWLKLNELAYLEKNFEQRPVLLLDDILSELDQEHRHQVEQLLQTGQAVVTTTEKTVIADLKKLIPNLQVVEL